MKITPEEAARIARLAHLRLSDEDLSRMRGQLDLVLEYVSVLATMEPAQGDAGEAAGLQNAALRADLLIPSLPNEEALEAAPESGQGHFTVPRVIP